MPALATRLLDTHPRSSVERLVVTHPSRHFLSVALLFHCQYTAEILNEEVDKKEDGEGVLCIIPYNNEYVSPILRAHAIVQLRNLAPLK